MTPILLLALTATLLPQSMDSAKSLARRGKWAQAAEAYEKLLEADHENGEAWFELGRALHAQKEYAAAAGANLEAARFPAFRPTALYNAACAQSLGGKVEAASESLASAREAGFLDFDLMASDTDLVALRERFPLDLPVPGAYSELKARNGVRLKYRVLAAPSADEKRERPVLVCFAPGSGPISCDWMIEHYFKGVEKQDEWVVLALVAPEKGWWTHPSHHALEEMLKTVKRSQPPVGGKFHLFGIAGGCDPALTYVGMSGSFFQSATLAACKSWGNYDDDLGRFRGYKVHLVAGADDEFTSAETRRMRKLFESNGVAATITNVPDGGLLLAGWGGTELLADLSTHLLK